jgi:protein-disulfide isomerase
MSAKKDRERRREERLRAEADAQAQDRRRRLLQMASAAAFLAIVGVAVLIVVNSNQDSGGNPESLTGVAEVNRELAGLPQHGLTLGDPKAPATLVEFGDLQCPICKAFSEEAIPAVIDSKVRTGEASIEFRNYTIIGAESVPAGAAAIAAGAQGRGWNFLELFYRNQGAEESGYVTDDFLTAIARKAGVEDLGSWNRERRSKRILAEVARTSEEARELGFTGTPSFATEGRSGRLEAVGTVGSAGDLEAAIDSAAQG